MNIDEYATKYISLYESFAETIQFVLRKALLAAEGIPHPQSIQNRAKSVESLRNRLSEEGKLESQALERDRRDLAGVRVIFYTNNDVEKFLNSPLIRENFEIDQGSTKIHHPIPENEGARYRGVHYTVKMREDRIRLPEYARFAGLRCEIQVQTILNHSWSETSHDIIYKEKLGDGYGKRAMEGIRRRFERIMDEYLIPAGYEIQKAQQEYERLLRGKALFDSDVVTLLDHAQDNNERYEILSSLQDNAIPYYDDVPAAYDQLRAPFLRLVLAARESGQVAIETAFGGMKGFSAEVITKLVVEIVEGLRYADAVGTLKLLIDIYRGEPSARIKEQIVSAVKHLAEYNIDAYQQFGPALQMALVSHLDGMDGAQVDEIHELAVAVWSDVLQLEISGQTWNAESVIFHSGAVPASEQLIEVRDRAIAALFAAYDRSTDDVQRRKVLGALENGVRTPSHVACPDELLVVTLNDSARIIDFMTERAPTTSYELLQHLEQRYLHIYHQVRILAEEARGAHWKDAAKLVAMIFRFRDAINSDESFVRYKVLVGYESVFPAHWADQQFGYEEEHAYRKQEVDRYVNEVDAESEGDWFELVARCARTKSKDLATFPVFGQFIARLSQQKPEVAERFLRKGNDDVGGFLPAFLEGLFLSDRQDIYERTLTEELDSTRNLVGVVHHLRYSEASQPHVARRLLDCAIANEDTWAVTNCLLFAMEAYGTEKLNDADAVIQDSLAYLTARGDPRWVWAAWFAAGRKAKFFQEVSLERVRQILANLTLIPQVDYRVERFLAFLSERHLEAVWDYFGDRLARAKQAIDENGAKFEAVPYRLHDLREQLSKNPELAVSKGMAWFHHDATLFRFRGGRLLYTAFPHDADEFMAVLVGLVQRGGEDEADFALAVLENYHGEPFTHVALKEILSRFPDDRRRAGSVRTSLENTGVVQGELGFAEAWRSKKVDLSHWLDDPRQAIRNFAEREIESLDLMVAEEERRAEASMTMRRMEYDD